jgi:hypothetical protein
MRPPRFGGTLHVESLSTGDAIAFHVLAVT